MMVLPLALDVSQRGGDRSRDGAPSVASNPKLDLDVEELAEALKPLAYDKRLSILRFLIRPHYVEEIASHLGIARQAAQKHVDQLLEIGVVDKQTGERRGRPVVEYVLVPQKLFALSEEFAQLGVLQPEEELPRAHTQVTDAPEAGAEMRPAGPLVAVVHGMHKGRAYKLVPPPGPWTLGRSGEQDICLDYDPFASNLHAEIRQESGDYLLVDAFSTNGTFLNWNRLDRGAEVVLEPGDIIGVGKSLLVFQV